MRLTSKSQVTIPKSVREKLSLAPGDAVGFREEGQVIIIEKTHEPNTKNAGELLFEHLRGKGQQLRGDNARISSDELRNLTRGPFDDLNAN